jgi:hypothetical protein
MIVSATVVNNVLVLVLDVLDVVGGGGGSDLPPVGISPAKVEAESAQMSASAIANRFMDVSSFEVFRKMPAFLHKPKLSRIGTATQEILQGGLERITISFAFAQLLANRKPQISCGRPLRSWIFLTLLRMSKPNSDAALL